MNKNINAWLLASAVLLAMLVACAPDPTPTLPARNPIPTNTPLQPVATKATTTPVATPSTSATVTERKDHDNAGDYVWDPAQVIRITLQGNAITANGAGVTIVGSKATITAPGTYSIGGSLTDGQIVVNTTGKGVVRLILNGVDLRSSTSSPIYVMKADKTVIVLADNSRNFVSDAKTYLLAAGEDEPDAAIFSKGDLTLFGNGSLTVEGNYQDGIASKDGLVIASGTLTVKAVDDGIRGRDYVVVKNGNITVNAQGDGFKSGNEEDASRGYVSIENGIINVTAGGDAIQAQTNITIANGKITLTSGGGSQGKIAATASAKGIKASVNITIGGGTLVINSADDAIHANDSIVINDGTFTIATGDDGIHADLTVKISGGTLRITESYEGIESEAVTINGGEIYIISRDDGINGADRQSGAGANPGFGGGFAPGAVPPGRGGVPPIGNFHLYINGGYIVIETVGGGDGIDINGSIEMTNGVVIVNGPTVRMNAAVDYDRSFKMTGGFLIAAGSSGMAQAPDDSSTQYALLLNLTTTQPPGTLVHIQSAGGKDVLTFSPTKEYQSIAFSSAALVKGETYDVYFGGSSTGTVKDNLYQGGIYTGGTKYTSFTTSSIVTRIGTPSRFR